MGNGSNKAPSPPPWHRMLRVESLQDGHHGWMHGYVGGWMDGWISAIEKPDTQLVDIVVIPICQEGNSMTSIVLIELDSEYHVVCFCEVWPLHYH